MTQVRVFHVAVLFLGCCVFGGLLSCDQYGGEPKKPSARRATPQPGRRTLSTHKPEIPDFADFNSVAQFEKFDELINAYFEAKGEKFAVNDGIVTIIKDGNPMHFGLSNVAQRCLKEDVNTWNSIIADHFQSLQDAAKAREAFAKDEKDFEKVRPILAVRMWPDTFLEREQWSDLITRSDIPGIKSTLAYDLPTTTQTVNASDTEAWGKTKDELFEFALKNVARMEAPAIDNVTTSDGHSFIRFVSEHSYAATWALFIEKYNQCIGQGGAALIAVPTRDILMAYPIQDRRAFSAVKRLTKIAIRIEKEGPGSVSPYVFWYHDGKFERFDWLQGETLEIEFPDGFDAAVHALDTK